VAVFFMSLTMRGDESLIAIIISDTMLNVLCYFY